MDLEKLIQKKIGLTHGDYFTAGIKYVQPCKEEKITYFNRDSSSYLQVKFVKLDNSTIFVLSKNQQTSSLHYEKYKYQNYLFEIQESKLFKCNQEIEKTFCTPNIEFIIMLSDIEWWSTANRSISHSLLTLKNGKVMLKNNILVLDYTFAVNAADIEYCFESVSDGVSGFVFVCNHYSGVLLDHVIIKYDSYNISHQNRISVVLSAGCIKDVLFLSHNLFLLQHKMCISIWNEMKEDVTNMMDTNGSVSFDKLTNEKNAHVVVCSIEIENQLIFTYLVIDQTEQNTILKSNFLIDIPDQEIVKERKLSKVKLTQFSSKIVAVVLFASNSNLHVIDICNKTTLAILIADVPNNSGNLMDFVSYGKDAYYIYTKNSNVLMEIFHLSYLKCDFSLKYIVAGYLLRNFSAEDLLQLKLPKSIIAIFFSL